MRRVAGAALLLCGLSLSPEGAAQLAATQSFTVAALPTSVAPPPAGKGVPRLATPLDLGAVGYVEEEWFVTGKANVYQYDSTGAVVVKTPNVEYTTRILVRRPVSPRRFSGTLHVETSHPQHGIDFVWPRVTDYVIARGDALVSITTRRSEASGIEHLKKFDPVRYAPINFTEDGLNWDVIGQVGRLLRTKSGANPLNEYDVRRVYASGWSGGGALVLVYINDFHARVRMPDGRPIFDGYLVGEPSGYPKINSTAEPLPNTDRRQRIQPAGVPVISLHTRAQESFRRREDGNQPANRYRVYEVAGAAHNNPRLPPIYKQSDRVFGQSGCGAKTSRFPMHHYFTSTLERLDAWAARGVMPPPSQHITLNADGTQRVDANGNALGGVRSSYLDVPTGRYLASTSGSTASPCAMDGAHDRFAADTLASLYGDRNGYVKRATARIDELERDGWLLAADAKELRDEAATTDSNLWRSR